MRQGWWQREVLVARDKKQVLRFAQDDNSSRDHNSHPLLDEHAISIGVEAVSGFDRMVISVHHEIFSAQRAHQHQQG